MLRPAAPYISVMKIRIIITDLRWKAFLNINVFKCFLKASQEEIFRISDGRLFHIRGPAIEKARFP